MPNKIETPFSAVNGGIVEAVLTGKTAVYPYADGKRTSETPTAYKITVALLGNRLNPLSIKIEGAKDPLSAVSDEQIEAACRGDDGVNFIFVTFKNALVTLYSINGQMVMSGKADSVQLLNDSKK